MEKSGDILKSINQGLNVARGVHGIRQLRDDWKRRKDTEAALGILQKGGEDFGELNPTAINAAKGLYQKQKDSELAYQRNMTRKQLENMTNEWNNAAKILATGGKTTQTITDAYTALNDNRTIEWDEHPGGKLTMRQMMKGEDDQWIPTGNNSTYENLDAAWEYANGMTRNAQTMNQQWLKQLETDEAIREKEKTGATGLTREKVNTEKAYQNRLNADTRRLGLLAEAAEEDAGYDFSKVPSMAGADSLQKFAAEQMLGQHGFVPQRDGSFIINEKNEKGEITNQAQIDGSYFRTNVDAMAKKLSDYMEAKGLNKKNDTHRRIALKALEDQKAREREYKEMMHKRAADHRARVEEELEAEKYLQRRRSSYENSPGRF